MKRKISLFLVILMNFFLVGCREEPYFTYEEIHEKNEKNLTLRKEKIQNITQTFSLFSQKNLNLYFFSPEENSFSGKGLLSLTFIQSGENNQGDFDFQMHYTDKSKNLPFELQTKGTFIGSGIQSRVKFDEMKVFMGTGNVNGEIFQMIGEEIKEKWIEIDRKEILDLLSYSGFSFETKLTQGMNLLGTAYHEIQTGWEEYYKENPRSWIFTDKGEDLQESLQTVVLPLLNFMGMSQEHIAFNERKEQGIEYRTPSKRTEVWQTLTLDLDDYVFDLQTSLSPQKITLHGSNFIEKASIQNLEEAFDLQIEEKKGKNLIVNFFKTLHGEKILKGDLGLNLKNDTTMIFQGSWYDKAKELMKDLYLQVNFEGKLTFSQFSGEILIPEESVSLTELLSF